MKFIVKKKEIESFLHPFSDKIIVLSLLLVFSLKGSYPAIVFFIFLLRDSIVGYIRMVASRDDVVIRGELYGKIITLFQFIVIFALMIKDFIIYGGLKDYSLAINTIILILTVIAIILSFFSVIHYSLVYGNNLKTRKKLGREVKGEKLLILANKKSGGYSDSYRRHLLKIFAKRRKAKIVYLHSEKKDMFEEIDKKIKGYNHIVIAGGDGSFESALNKTILSGRSLGFFPLGAGNAFYSYFYKGKRFEYLRSRFPFREVLLDVLELKWEKGKIQTLFLEIGVDAEVARIIKNKKNHTFADYFSASTEITFGKKINYNLECIVDGKTYHWKNSVNLILGKIPYLGYGIRSLLGSIDDDDGFIQGMACINTHSPIFNKFLRIWSLFLTQMGLVKSPLLALKGKEFVIRSSKSFPVQAGGEFLGYAKWVKVKIVRKQKVLMI
ncbi:MAG: hypothetical protein KKD75_01895 [Nanoarchaeota archaeon]|nr:hypothetical protein [Nanoarchaeota archaeon]MBU1632292.1 hypothetical protein [Nanoarchaeota archaeon]MBU1875767.1 hypothetical protein [Nanoarchaeota archaeon]